MTTTAQEQMGRTTPSVGALLPTDEAIDYPFSDGEPMGESQPHVDAIRAMLDALDDLFWNDDDVSVHGNVHWYWKQGDTSLTRAPDAMVIPGVTMDFHRTSFKSWEHGGAVPSAIIETVSKNNYRTTLSEVREDYEENGVREYFIFDAMRLYLSAPLIGFRLSGGRYRRLVAEQDGSIVSNELNVRLLPEGQFLRMIDLRTGEPIPTRPERIAFYEGQFAEWKAKMAEQDAILAESKAVIAECVAKLAESKAVIAERDAKLAESKAEIAERDTLLAESKSLIAERDAKLAESIALIAERDARFAEQAAELQQAKELLQKFGADPEAIE